MLRARGHAIRARLEDLDRPGLGVCALGFLHLRAHPIPRKAIGDEHHVAVQAGNAGPAEGQRIDGQLEDLALGGPGGGGAFHLT